MNGNQSNEPRSGLVMRIIEPVIVGLCLPFYAVVWPLSAIRMAVIAKKIRPKDCPNCNAPVDLYVPDQSQRAVCKYCNHILDVKPGGSLAVIEKLRVKAQPRIPLGSTGTFHEGSETKQLRVIGYIEAK